MGDTVAISRVVLDAILAEAAGSRDEVCGLLLGRDEQRPPRSLCTREGGCPDWVPAFAGTQQIENAVSCRNVAPDRARHFEIDPAALIAAHRAARDGGPAIVGYYHSHPSGNATPSATDAATAAPDGSIWLIVAGDEARAYRAACDGSLHRRFDPVALLVAEDGDLRQSGT